VNYKQKAPLCQEGLQWITTASKSLYSHNTFPDLITPAHLIYFTKNAKDKKINIKQIVQALISKLRPFELQP